MTVHTLKQCRPDQEETEYFWKLFHAAQRNDARWHGSEISIIADELSRTDLDRNQKLFLLRSWQVLVDDKGGFGRFMGAFDTYVYNMQDPDDDCVAWKPELAQILNDGNCFDVLLDAYQEAQQRIAELEAWTVNLPKRSVGEVMHMSGFSRDYAEVSKEQPTPVVPESISVRQAISALESADSVTTIGQAYKMGWNACRAAMLQGGQPVSNRDELQVIGWLRSDYNSDDKRDPNAPLFMLGSNDPSDAWGVKYIPLSGNSPVIPGGWVMVPKKLTAENGAKSLLSGEFLETTFISCPECFADEECESCDGSGRIKIEVPVSWTTIKAIWNKGVEHFRSSTATGDN